MKKIIGEILNEREVPEGVKDRLLAAARIQILMKDLGGLFSHNVPKSSADMIETILPKSKKNKK